MKGKESWQVVVTEFHGPRDSLCSPFLRGEIVFGTVITTETRRNTENALRHFKLGHYLAKIHSCAFFDPRDMLRRPDPRVLAQGAFYMGGGFRNTPLLSLNDPHISNGDCE